MSGSMGPQIELIPIFCITVINPRMRNRKQHQEIIENIRLIGLKKPITVSPRGLVDGVQHYDLVCGQGRLEAFKALGQEVIPAIVQESSLEDCLLKSLVENVARRQHPAVEQLQEVNRLKTRGYEEADIAERLGVSINWVSMIVNLLEHGEQRLLKGVESGLIPLSLAVSIARSSDAEIQDLLTEAYTNGQFRGKKLTAVRRLLEQRKKQSRLRQDRPSLTGPRKRTSVNDLRRLYQTEVEKHRIAIKRADFFHQRVMFIARALKELLTEGPEFLDLLVAEDLQSIPRQLDAKIGWR